MAANGEKDPALIHPLFKSPEDVVAATNMSREAKVDVLRRWEYDLREIKVAEEEGMSPGRALDSNDLLARVHAALERLGAGPPPATEAPTKQSG
ncbi:MAG: hypothetical protein RIC93_03215 [Alphaproteobacteria bacterium]